MVGFNCYALSLNAVISCVGIYYFNIATGQCNFVASDQIKYINDGLYGANISGIYF